MSVKQQPQSTSAETKKIDKMMMVKIISWPLVWMLEIVFSVAHDILFTSIFEWYSGVFQQAGRALLKEDLKHEQKDNNIQNAKLNKRKGGVITGNSVACKQIIETGDQAVGRAENGQTQVNNQSDGREEVVEHIELSKEISISNRDSVQTMNRRIIPELYESVQPEIRRPKPIKQTLLPVKTEITRIPRLDEAVQLEDGRPKQPVKTLNIRKFPKFHNTVQPNIKTKQDGENCDKGLQEERNKETFLWPRDEGILRDLRKERTGCKPDKAAIEKLVDLGIYRNMEDYLTEDHNNNGISDVTGSASECSTRIRRNNFHNNNAINDVAGLASECWRTRIRRNNLRLKSFPGSGRARKT